MEISPKFIFSAPVSHAFEAGAIFKYCVGIRRLPIPLITFAATDAR